MNSKSYSFFVVRMNSTVRVYINDKRIATGKPWKNQFLQVFPEKKTFASEAEWRTSIYESLHPTIKFVVEEPKKKKVKEVAPPVKVELTPVPPPVPNPAKTVINPEDEEEVVDDNWICGYCRLPRGNDHRMCICRGYNFSIAAWEDGRIYPNKVKVQKTATVSKDKNDWTYQKAHRMTFPPGTYYIGDLCYALDETLYDKVFGPKYNEGCYTSKSNPSDVFMMGDTGGDGEFKGTDGKMYPVDAGIIGIASESVLDPDKKPYAGSMYTFKGDVSVRFREDKFQFYSNAIGDPNLTIYIYEEEEEEYNEDSE